MNKDPTGAERQRRWRVKQREARTTYERYMQALERIADGENDPVGIATEALRSRKPLPNYRWRAEQEAKKKRAQDARDQRSKAAITEYRAWLLVGRPPIAHYARVRDKSRSAMERLLRKGERAMDLPYDQRRLGWGYRNRTYDTIAEISKKEGRHK